MGGWDWAWGRDTTFHNFGIACGDVTQGLTGDSRGILHLKSLEPARWGPTFQERVMAATLRAL